MKLSAPTLVIFLVSLVIAILGILAGLGIAAVIPLPAFWVLAISYGVLAVGCLFTGI
ncbi:MAG: hypothetical protein ACR2OR_04960 [Hyphomicrobiales bacterium]